MSNKHHITIYCTVDGIKTPLLKIRCDEFDFTNFRKSNDSKSFSINGAFFELADDGIEIHSIDTGLDQNKSG